VWDLFYEMYHLKLSTSKSHNAFNRMHAGDKVCGPLHDNHIVLAVLRKLCRPCEFNLIVEDKYFRRETSHLSACGKAFLCHPYTVVTTCVESGALFSVHVFCNSA
jgi:hypothetical protein